MLKEKTAVLTAAAAFGSLPCNQPAFTHEPAGGRSRKQLRAGGRPAAVDRNPRESGGCCGREVASRFSRPFASFYVFRSFSPVVRGAHLPSIGTCGRPIGCPKRSRQFRLDIPLVKCRFSSSNAARSGRLLAITFHWAASGRGFQFEIQERWIPASLRSSFGENIDFSRAASAFLTPARRESNFRENNGPHIAFARGDGG